MNAEPPSSHGQGAQPRIQRRAARAPAAQSAIGANSRRSPQSLLPAALIWFQLVYLTIPSDILEEQKGVLLMSANPVSRIVKLVLLSLGVMVLVGRAQLSRQLLPQVNIFFRAFLVLVPLSVLWSISPGDTAARFMSILVVCAVSVAFCVSSWHSTRFQSVVRPVVTLLLVGSVIFGLMAPDLAIDQGEGTLREAWHGLTGHKNFFGQLAAFGLIFWLHAGLTRQVKFWQSLLGSVLSFGCVLLSRSSTSLMSALSVTLFLVMLMRTPTSLRRYMPILIALFATAVLTYALAVLNLVPGTGILLEPIAAITGKDMTFSSRSEIWRIIKDHIQLSPVLGSGYGAYWIGPVPSSPSYTFLTQMWFYPTESHNGYLEIVNDLGYVGLICLLGFLIVYIRQSLQLMKVDRPQGVLLLALFFQQAITNLSESCWLSINASFVFPIMTLAVLSLARGLLERDRNLSPGRTAVARPEPRGAPRRRLVLGGSSTPNY